MDGNAHDPYWQNNLFREDFFVLPYEDELMERAKTVRDHNEDAVRHCVERLLWEFQNSAEFKREIIIPLLYLREDVQLSWIAEACFCDVHQLCEIAKAHPILAFNCLDCGMELPVRSREHLINLARSLGAFCEGQTSDRLVDLLCKTCINLRDERDEEQRRMDHLRQQALLAEYRKLPYADRRKSREWEVLRKQVLRRDDYRCRMCNRNDLPLHPHHRTYATYAEERLEDLITLCAECHGLFHSLSDVS
jgi:5-methylcytosine-specific restriction endonuclease McrA